MCTVQCYFIKIKIKIKKKKVIEKAYNNSCWGTVLCGPVSTVDNQLSYLKKPASLVLIMESCAKMNVSAAANYQL